MPSSSLFKKGKLHSSCSVKENINKAILGYLEILEKHNEPILPSIYEDIVEIKL